MRSRSDAGQTLVTSGGRRGCGIREPGGAYLAVPLAPWGRPVEEFLIDPAVVLDAIALGLSSVGVTLVDRDHATHVLDVVGRAHYGTVAEFVDEIRRIGGVQANREDDRFRAAR
ncbi:MAG: hypothetical protein ABSG43_21600 [Solirubrobacteraceae bacterium]|jgi:hypothetical protein